MKFDEIWMISPRNEAVTFPRQVKAKNTFRYDIATWPTNLIRL